MSNIEKLSELVREQEGLQSQLRQELEQLRALDYVSANASLEAQIAQCRQELEELHAAHDALAGENKTLRETVEKQAYAQKNADMRTAWQRIDTYQWQVQQSYLHQIAEMEQRYNASLQAIANEFASAQAVSAPALDEKIAECRALLAQTMEQHRRELAARLAKEQAERSGEFATLDGQPVTQAEIGMQISGVKGAADKTKRRGELEFKLGGRIANVLGILLILFGVIVGMQYTYTYLLTSSLLRSAAAYLLGVLFLAGGELLGRRQRTMFSLGITAGGIAILFTATAISLFVLEVLSLYVAFFLCALTAALAMLLSLRYQSQMIANFALLGGFLPVFVLEFGNPGMLYLVMAYLVLLNFFALAISAQRGWRSVKYVSLALNTFTSSAIIFSDSGSTPVNLLYVTVCFALYVFIAVLHPMREKTALDRGTMVVVVLNSFTNCLFVFGIMTIGELNDWLGLTALVLAVFYYGFSWYLTGRMEDSRPNTLYLATSLVFAVLVVPLQFDERWIAMGWLLEAAVLIVAGMKTREKWYGRIGKAAYALSLLAFLLFDAHYTYTTFFFMKLTAIVASSAFILAAGIHFAGDRQTAFDGKSGRTLRWMKHYVTALVYCYLIHAIMHVQSALHARSGWDLSVLALVVTAGYAAALLKLPQLLRDKVTEWSSTALFALAALSALVLNMTYNGHIRDARIPLVLSYVLINICGFVGIAMAARRIVQARKTDEQFRPLIVFSYVLIAILQMLSVQARLAFNDMILSFVLIAAAVVYIVHGFRKNASYTRRTGLGLAVAAIVKFFLVDLSFLETWQTILSYFVLGGVLIGISYLYQHFSKRMLETGGAQENHLEGGTHDDAQ